MAIDKKLLKEDTDLNNFGREQNAGFVKTISNFVNKFKTSKFPGGRPKKYTTKYMDNDAPVGGWYSILKQWYIDALSQSTERMELYKQYGFLVMNLSEAIASANIYSDNTISGAIGGLENYMVMIDESALLVKELEDVVKETEMRTQIKEQIWDIAREMTIYGDEWDEIVIIQDTDNKFWIDKLNQLPREQMYADVDERGAWVNPEYPYYQKRDTYDKSPIRFDWWRTIHFKLGRGVYGFDKALFANASLRLGRQLLWLDDSLVLGRMSKAWMRYAYLINTVGMNADDAWEYVQKYAARVERKEIIDRETGQINPTDSPPLPGKDLFLPSGDTPGSTADIKVLTGDTNISNIADMLYLQAKFLMALSMPKAYVGLEGDVRGKATLTQIDVQFARQVRRKQAALVPGLKEFYNLAFILAGYDPQSFSWEIVFPELNTTDELMRWEMMKLKGEVAKMFVVDIGNVNDEWVYREILGFTDQDIEDYGI